MTIRRVLLLDFLPHNIDAALLVLRVGLGLPLLILHGWVKVTGFSKLSGGFPDPLGVGSPASLVLAIFAEVVCAALLAIGLLTRAAAAILVITMAVAFIAVHKAALTGPTSGEMAYIYLVGFIALLIAGGGRFSLDAKLGGKSRT